MQRLCLEGTTERSDSNRGRSPRKKQLQQFCLEGSTPVAMLIVQVLWRSAFQAQTLHVYMNQCQDKTNPSLVTGLRCKPYTRNPFDYRLLCELVLG